MDMYHGSEILEKIADYFDVSTDYLLGRTDNPFPSAMEGDNDFVATLKELTENSSGNIVPQIVIYIIPNNL